MIRLRLFTFLALSAACTLRADLPAGWIGDHLDRMSHLFNSLDQNDPDLEEILVQWKKGEREKAAESLITYYRTQTFDLSALEAAYFPADPPQWAETALDDSFMILGEWVTVPRSSSGALDWDYKGTNNDKEIAWMLNRHFFLPVLAEAFRQSQQEDHRVLLNDLLQSWIADSAYPDRITFSARWRALEAARRVLNSWIHVFYGSMDLLDDATILLMLSSVPDHADALYEHASFWGGNHLLTEKTALLAIAAAWPQFKNSDKWKSSAIKDVSSQLLEQSYPDGSYMELSNHYQRVVLSNTLPLLKLLRQEMPAYKDSDIYRRIEKMWEFFTFSSSPDGSGPVNNASDLEYNAHFINSAWQYFNRPDWRFVASHGKDGAAPAGSASRFFNWAGQVYMRNNWSNTADWVYFDAGPYGTAHQHLDRLHLSVSLKGRKLLGDSGRYTYKPGEWKDYFTGPQAHSVVLMDGQHARQGPWKVKMPMQTAFQETSNAVYASAVAHFNNTYDIFRSPVPWRRHVIYDRSGFVIVLDSLMPFKMSAVEIIWQFAEGISREEAERIVNPDSLPDSSFVLEGDTSDPTGGFFSADYNRKVPTIQLVQHYRINKPTTIINIIQSPADPPLTGSVVRPGGPDSIIFTVQSKNSIISKGEITKKGDSWLLNYSAIAQ